MSRPIDDFLRQGYNSVCVVACCLHIKIFPISGRHLLTSVLLTQPVGGRFLWTQAAYILYTPEKKSSYAVREDILVAQQRYTAGKSNKMKRTPER